MLVKDGSVLGRHGAAAARESYADAVNRATCEELGRARIMADYDLAPNNPARQMGRVLTPRQLEALVARLGVPNLCAETHPTNPSKRCLWQDRSDGRRLVCVYENNPMPEFSIIMGVDKWEPDPSYLDGGRVAQRHDMSGGSAPVTNAEAATLLDRHGLDGALTELEARASESSHLGMVKIRVPGHEQVRGWRTVLVYLMQQGLVSPEQVRGVVADADRASWAGLTGSQPGALNSWLS